MTDRSWTYPQDLLEALARFGLAPSSATPPRFVRDQVNELYRFEIRRLRDQLRAGVVPKADYVGLVIELRRKYWPLTLQPADWERISNPELRNPEPQMKIALIQHHVTSDLAANLRRGLDATRRAAADGASLVAFPELAFTPFYPQRPATGDVRDLAEPVPGPTTEAFSALARELGIVIVLNVFERDGNRTYDSSPVIDADGRLLGRTRMVHITEYPCFHERQYYHPSDLGAPVFDTRIGRVGVAICYDRHFPEYMRALALNGADLVVVPQAGCVDEWPAGLFEGEMQTAAFQNGYFVALCNRVGVEDRLTFAGESFVCGPDGAVLARAPKSADAVLVAEIDLAAAATSHARRILLKDRRPTLYADWVGR